MPVSGQVFLSQTLKKTRALILKQQRDPSAGLPISSTLRQWRPKLLSDQHPGGDILAAEILLLILLLLLPAPSLTHWADSRDGWQHTNHWFLLLEEADLH